MAGSLASINILFRVDLKDFSTQLQNSVRELKKTGEAMQNLGRNLSLSLTAPLALAGGAAIKLASDFDESNNKVSVAFKDSAATVQAFAKTTLTSFGIAEGSALDMAALFGDMATSMGLPQAEAAKLSTSLVGLAGDLASFKNIGIAQATTALNGIFTGETESLKTLGIVMTETNLAQFALDQGITKSLKNFTQAEKVQLRYAYVMKQTTNAQGDFARTGGGAANQMRVFQESLKELGVQFGQVILPAFTKAIKYVNDVIASFKGLSEGTRETIIVVAGLAAAIGPVVYVIGGALKVIADLRVAFAALQVFMVANVATLATIAAIAGVAFLAYKAFSSVSKEVSATEKNLIEVRENAAKAAASEISELYRLIAVAKDDKVSKDNRLAAIKAINEISPQYLKDITIETINTNEAKKAIDRYIVSLKEKAFAEAAQAKQKQLADKIIDIRSAPTIPIKGANDITDSYDLEAFIKTANLSAFANEKLRKTFEPLFIQKKKDIESLEKQIDKLNSYSIAAAKASGVNKESTTIVETNGKAVKKTIEYYQGLISELEDLNKKGETTTAGIKKNNAQISTYQKEIEKLNGTLAAFGSIKYFEDQISQLEKLRTTTVSSRGDVQVLDEKILALREKISKLEGKRIEIVSVFKTSEDNKLEAPSFSYGENNDRIIQLQKERDAFLAVQSKYEEGTIKFEEYAKRIQQLDFSIEFNRGGGLVEPLNRTLTEAEVRLMLFKDRMAEINLQFTDGITKAFETAAEGVLTGFGEILGGLASGATGIQDIFGLLGGTLGNLLVELGKIAIQTAIGIEAIKTALKTFNPFVAAAAGVALIALGSVIKNKVKDAGAFAEGGIVGGASFTGDRLFARVNSGEMILNERQQRNLYGMITPAASVQPIEIFGQTRISGSDLDIIFERYLKTKSRLS